MPDEHDPPAPASPRRSDGEPVPDPSGAHPPGEPRGDEAGHDPDRETPGDAVVAGAAYAALGILGAFWGMIGAVVQAWPAGPEPVLGVVAVLATFGFVHLAGRGMGARLGAVVPGVAWGVVVLLISQQRPEGDLIIAGSLSGYVYILGGMIAVVAAVLLVPARRPAGSWLTAGADVTRR
ncbi:DUF6113 family protein [Actinomadura flavalba]|uniref:DUF6113 family protein n=1 Tax=Actinomadura flavalba TaxID=1120938 RepID=UPI000371C398|nr:DUF6113 family protein [Actinomadura flavalba]